MGCQFDQFIDRRNTQSQKWDGVLEMFGEENLIPMWIADMDFRPPQEVVEAVTKRPPMGSTATSQAKGLRRCNP